MTTSPAKTPRRARVLRWALLATAALAAVTGNADVIGISQVGLAALQTNHLVEPVLRADGKGWIIVGHVIVLRDANDRPILPNPRSYYMFRPLKGPFTPTDVNGNPDANAHEVRLAFAWTAQMDRAIASIDDVRGVISNRDLLPEWCRGAPGPPRRTRPHRRNAPEDGRARGGLSRHRGQGG